MSGIPSLPPPPSSPTCGTSYGPDGLLDIVVLSPSADCEKAKAAADEYMASVDGFITNTLMTTGNGWACWTDPGDNGQIVQCANDDEAVSLNRRIH